MLTLEALRGRVYDLDSHEQVAVGNYGEFFDERANAYLEINPMRHLIERDSNPPEMEMTQEAVWVKKDNDAPWISDMNRRTQVLDVMGIQRALVFPGMPLGAMIHALNGLGGLAGFDVPTDEERKLAWDAIDAYNDWVIEFTPRFGDRLRVAGVIGSARPGATVETLVGEAQKLIKAGVKVAFIPIGAPPLGISPADPSLDPFYKALTNADMPLVAHPPAGVGYAPGWAHVDIAGLGSITQPAETFIRMMVLGGVFERHPTLRFGIIESGAHWIGPLAEFMDWAVDGEKAPLQHRLTSYGNVELSMKPSEYLNRNVRVTPFNFEPVENWFEQYPQIQNCYCFSSDYPHHEGREWPIDRFYEQIAHLGNEIIEKFFFKNAELLLP